MAMMEDLHHIINLTDEEGSNPGELLDRRAILTPAIQRTIAALGGIEGGVYQLGDECYGCLKDLKKFWRKDDTDDERTVARIFWECRLLENDLVPILLETAGKGAATHKCAIAVADLLTAMTWPIDLTEELTELDEERDENTDYTTLIQAQLAYKVALLQPGVVKSLIDIAIPYIAKDKWDRTEREGQVVNVTLHLFRNLAFIKDLPPNTHLSSNRAELSSLQSKLITQMSEHLVLDLFLTIASNALDDSFLNQWNCLMLEIFYLLFRSLKPSSLAENQATQPRRELARLLETEGRSKLEERKKWTSSRHSRFGTTIAVKSKANNEEKVILHKQAAVGRSAVEALDRGKKTLTKRAKMHDALGSTTILTVEAKTILQAVARDFIISCFNPFLASLLKDIRSERPKVTEKDNLRLLFVTKWFIDFFLCGRARDSQRSASKEDEMEFALVVEVVQRSWAGWVIRRMREAWEDKPKQWTELQAGIECLTQLLLLVDAMSTAEDVAIKDAAGQLQYQIYYNGEALERIMECMRSYKEQSFSYLDSAVHLSYVLLRMLERWGKQNGQMYIRRASKKKQKSALNGIPEEEGIPDGDTDDEQMEKMQEMLQEMTLEKFESKFASEDITRTLLAYVSRHREFDGAEQMKRVVSLMHRQAVKAKAEGLFYKVSTLNLFRSLLGERKTFPKDQCYKDLINLITYLLRQFFKAVEKDRMVLIEAFYPKNRGLWKNLSSWQPPEPKRRMENGRGGDGGSEEDVSTSRVPPDVRVKRGHSWTEQLGIAVACLTEKDQRNLVEWTKELLIMIIGIKQLTIDEIDKDRLRHADSDEELGEGVDQDVQTLRKSDMPSMEAMAKLEDFLIPYTASWHSEAATKNAHLKLLWNLLGFTVITEDEEELQWMCPASKMPGELDRSLRLINNYILDPIDLGGRKATDRISKAKLKKPKEKSSHQRRQRTGTAPSPLGDDDPPHSDEELNSEGGWLSDPEKLLEKVKKTSSRKEKRKREIKEFLSAQFIEDSDAELGNDDEFFAREAAIKKRMEEEAAKVHLVQGGQTKKRKKRQTVGADDDEQDEGATRRKRPRTTSPSMVSMHSIGSDDERPVTEASTPETSPPSISGRRSPPPLSSREASSAPDDEEISEGASPVERERRQQKESQEDMDLSEEEALTTRRRRPARRVINLSDEEDG